MGLIKWVNKRLEKFDAFDLGLTKITVAAFVLMIAKIWPPILSLEWYWYAVIFVLALIKPLTKIFK